MSAAPIDPTPKPCDGFPIFSAENAEKMGHGASVLQAGSIVRARGKPGIDVRPGLLARPAPGHHPDVSPGDTEDLGISTARFCQSMLPIGKAG